MDGQSREAERAIGRMPQVNEHAGETALVMIQMHIQECDRRHTFIANEFRELKQNQKETSRNISKLTYYLMAIVAATGGTGLVFNDNVLKFLGAFF